MASVTHHPKVNLMRLRNTVASYGFVARSLHWIIVLGIIAQYFLAEAEESQRAAGAAMSPMDWHMSLGITLLALAVARVLWRIFDRTPAWPAQMRGYERFFAAFVHLALYALLFAIPISGWVLASVEGESLSLFGWFDVPALGPPGGEEREHLVEEVHEVLFNALFVLAIVHVVAALKHHFIDRDNVLRRMLFGAR
jgi:cytochrome b561